MAEIINLRLARKARKRGDAERLAAENRAKFGQNKAAKARQRQEAERAQRTLDGARIGDRPDKSGE
ncbi:MAG: DUF4169 family protein [Sphingobium sp.]|nr:DUF4169 family protein [Sphingobium sp.]